MNIIISSLIIFLLIFGCASRNTKIYQLELDEKQKRNFERLPNDVRKFISYVANEEYLALTKYLADEIIIGIDDRKIIKYKVKEEEKSYSSKKSLLYELIFDTARLKESHRLNSFSYSIKEILSSKQALFGGTGVLIDDIAPFKLTDYSELPAPSAGFGLFENGDHYWINFICDKDKNCKLIRIDIQHLLGLNEGLTKIESDVIDLIIMENNKLLNYVADQICLSDIEYRTCYSKWKAIAGYRTKTGLLYNHLYSSNRFLDGLMNAKNRITASRDPLYPKEIRRIIRFPVIGNDISFNSIDFECKDEQYKNCKIWNIKNLSY